MTEDFTPGPLGCIIREDYTLETDERIARSTGQSIFFGDSAAQYVGRWKYLKSRGVSCVFLLDKWKSLLPLKPHFQRRGTCFPAGSLVLMADGSEKPIEKVRIGDLVIGHSGKPRAVLQCGTFEYFGRMASVKASRFFEPVTCTQEHEFLECVNDVVPTGARVQYEGKRERVYFRQGINKWTSADQLRKGSRLHVIQPQIESSPLMLDLAKYCTDDVVRMHKEPTVTLTTVRKKQTRQSVPRFLEFNEQMAFIVGLYAAEGSSESRRVTFTLDARRTDLIEKIRQWVSVAFPGVFVSVNERPPRFTAINIRVNCAIFADIIREYLPGKALTKCPHYRILSLPESVRKAFLDGWLAGDGCEYIKRNPANTGVTSSPTMMRFMRTLCLSLGINPAITQRKQSSHQNGPAYDITFSGSEYARLHGREIERVAGEIHERSEIGWVTPVDSVTLSDWTETEVYNLEVEEDHSYVVNGLAVANCVARGWHYATQASYLCALAGGTQVGNPLEIAWEPAYPGSRVYVGKGSISGDGSVGSWAGEWYAGVDGVGGFVPRGVYGSADLRQDNESWAVSNADRGDRLPKELLDACAQHTCTVHRVRNNHEIADAIASEYGVARCWNQLFGNRDRNGMSKPARKGAHCQAAVGVFVMPNGEDGIIEAQSCGPNMPSGPTTLMTADGPVELPSWCYGVSFRDYEMAQNSDKWWEAHAVGVRIGQEMR